MLGFPVDGAVAVAGGNFGRPRDPAWRADLRADPRATVIGDRGPRDELHGAERAAVWRQGLTIFPGADAYGTRSGRTIPGVPARMSSPPQEWRSGPARCPAMTSPLPDPATEFGARVAGRLGAERTAWLTVVDAAGTPQPAPIWFLWDGDTALLYSDRRARRLAHLRTNPRVALHLDGDQYGGDIVVLTGEITEVPDEPAVPDNPAYLAKYGAQIADGPWGTPEVFAQTYSVALRFRPRRVRGH